MLIGLHGRKRSGKDTIYERALVLFPERNPERVAFADKLKQTLADSLGIERHMVDTYKLAEDNCRVQLLMADEHGPAKYSVDVDISFRELLQRFGTEAMRNNTWPDIWIDLALPLSFDTRYHRNRLIFVTDVRFPNEAQRIRELGGHIWHVNGGDPPDGHPSEQILPVMGDDYIIDNSRRDDFFAHLDLSITATISAMESEAKAHGALTRGVTQ